MGYQSEAAKVRDMQNMMEYIKGRIIDVGCGPDKITPNAVGIDGRDFPGVDFVTEDYNLINILRGKIDMASIDTIFSSHFLEHIPDPYNTIMYWSTFLKLGGHLVLYLPDKFYYNNFDNPEHMFNWSYDDFLFWFKRSFCGEGKDFKGNHLQKYFELVDSGMHVGDDLYSFFIIAKRV